MTLNSIPTFITALLSLGLGIFILARNRTSKLNWTFAAWCFLTFYWQTCWTILFNVQDLFVADLLARLGYSGIIFIPIVFFHFVVEFTKAGRERFLSYLFYIWAEFCDLRLDDKLSCQRHLPLLVGTLSSGRHFALFLSSDVARDAALGPAVVVAI